MTRELRELHMQLAAAEQKAREALDREDEAAAKAAVAEVHRLRAAILKVEAREREEKDAIQPGRVVAGDGRPMLGGGPLGAAARRRDIFGQAIIEAGWHLRERPTVALPLAQVLPGEETWRVRPAEGILPLGRDTRWIYPLLPARDLAEDTAVEDFRQTARVVTGAVERDPGATTEKATLAVSIDHVVEKVRQLAVVIPDIPNQVLASIESAADFFASEGRFAVEQALDRHVLAQILAANPPQSYAGEGLIERVRHAIAAMRADGVDPDVLVLSPADAAALDLTKTADGLYIYQTREAGAASPLFGLRVVEHPDVTAPLLLDTRQLGVLYRGSLRVAADPYTGFNRNVTNMRFEVNALMHVRNARAAHLIQQAA